MIARKDFHAFAAGMVEENEIFKQIHEILFSADTEQHRFKVNCADLVFFQTLPLMEEIVLGTHRTNLGFKTIGQHQKSVEMEQLRNRGKIIGIIAVISGFDIHVLLFQFHK